MVEYQTELDTVLKAVADPIRRQLLADLREGPKTVGELAGPLAMSFAGASKHIGVLVRARLVRQEKHGRERVCELRARSLQPLQEWLDSYAEFWSGRLDALELALKENEHGKE
ncbi:MAG: metalloregulator ArsR/SmtB family transcription factor [Pseudomonadota bacterium]